MKDEQEKCDNRWIPVSTMPEEDAEVLICTKWETMYLAQRKWSEIFKADVFICDDGQHYEVRDVTYWMTLPPVPNKTE